MKQKTLQRYPHAEQARDFALRTKDVRPGILPIHKTQSLSEFLKQLPPNIDFNEMCKKLLSVSLRAISESCNIATGSPMDVLYNINFSCANTATIVSALLKAEEESINTPQKIVFGTAFAINKSGRKINSQHFWLQSEESGEIFQNVDAGSLKGCEIILLKPKFEYNNALEFGAVSAWKKYKKVKSRTQ